MINSDKNKIIGFNSNDFNIIVNGGCNNIKNISDPNKIGEVINSDGEVISKITPLIMIINSSRKEWRNIVKSLINIGADPNLQIKYYDKDTSAKEITDTYRGGF